MPIKPELRYFYPIDWKQISHWVRLVRAKGHCQVSSFAAALAGGYSSSTVAIT